MMQLNGPAMRDGFHVLRDRYSPPADSVQLAPEAKRKISICHLFLNYKLSITDVAKTLDETLTRNGIQHTYKVTEGRHEWTVWRHHLNEFAQLLFK